MHIPTLLFTGASGFLGRNILRKLSESYLIETLGISSEDTYHVDISKTVPALDKRYDIILHAAGKVHGNTDASHFGQLFFEVNLQGTLNLCAALEKFKLPRAFIFISTVAVYGLNSGELITEDYPLAGCTSYALSKIQAEWFLQDWCRLHNITLTILRPALIAGINPPGNLGALIGGIKSNTYLSIGKGGAKKSIIMAEDIARIIPEVSDVGGIFNLTDDHHPSFSELEDLISNQLGKKRPISIPYSAAKALALIGDLAGKRFPLNSSILNKIVNTLTFSNKKARSVLNWSPLDVLENFKIG